MPTVLGSNPMLTPLPKVEKLGFPQLVINKSKNINGFSQLTLRNNIMP